MSKGEPQSEEQRDVFDRIVERNRLLMLVLANDTPEEQKRNYLERMLAEDPFHD